MDTDNKVFVPNSMSLQFFFFLQKFFLVDLKTKCKILQKIFKAQCK